jgi:hypothetical protein
MMNMIREQEAQPRQVNKMARIDDAMIKLMSATDWLEDFVTDLITGPPDGDQDRAIGYGPGGPATLGDFLSTLPDRIQYVADKIDACHKRLNRALFEVPGQDKVKIGHLPNIDFGGFPAQWESGHSGVFLRVDLFEGIDMEDPNG